MDFEVPKQSQEKTKESSVKSQPSIFDLLFCSECEETFTSKKEESRHRCAADPSRFDSIGVDSEEEDSNPESDEESLESDKESDKEAPDSDKESPESDKETPESDKESPKSDKEPLDSDNESNTEDKKGKSFFE